MVATALEQEKPRGTRVSIYSLLFALFVVVVLVLQVVTGTPFQFALLVSLFNILSFVTIRVLGGPTTLPGICVTVFALQHVIVSQVAKAVMLQSATDRMLAPYDTILVYNLGMFGILCAALVYRLFRIDSVRPLFDIELDHRRLSIMAMLLTIFSLWRFFALQKFGVFEGAAGGVYVGGFVGPLRQFGFLSTLAVSCGTAAVILKSGGRRCMGLWNSLAIVGPILYGIIGAGRQESATSIVTFVFTLYAFKFKLKPAHYVFVAFAFYLLQFIIFPYALYARGEGGVRIGSFEERVVKAANLLMEFTFSPKKKVEEEEKINPTLPWSLQRMYYYGSPLPTLDRYSVILTTDNIVNAVLAKGPMGPETLYAGFNMILPRFLNTEKEALGTANAIAHYGDGLVGETDFYTQITMGIVPEGFYAYKWPGVFALTFLVSTAFFTVYRLMFRSTMFKNVFVTALMFTTTWNYSEATMSGQTLNIIQFPIYYIVAVMPLAIFARSITKKVREAKFVFEGQPKAQLEPGLVPEN